MTRLRRLRDGVLSRLSHERFAVRFCRREVAYSLAFLAPASAPLGMTKRQIAALGCAYALRSVEGLGECDLPGRLHDHLGRWFAPVARN